jgi:hypothetical protein
MPATNGLLENWKCLLACTLVSMSPFQYGIDFGAIGGLQAMKGFLAVRNTSTLRKAEIDDGRTGLRAQRPSFANRLQHFA